MPHSLCKWFFSYCTQLDSVDVNDYHCFCTKKKQNKEEKAVGGGGEEDMQIKENI